MTPDIELVQLTHEELRGLSESRPALHLAGVPEGALPRRMLWSVRLGSLMPVHLLSGACPS